MSTTGTIIMGAGGFGAMLAQALPPAAEGWTALGSLGLIIVGLLWRDKQKDQRLDEKDKKYEALSERSITALEANKTALEKVCAKLDEQTGHLGALRQDIINFVVGVNEKSDPERRAWKPGDPDRRASAEPRDPGGRHS